MTTLFIIGGCGVLAGITIMTSLYFKTAGELEAMKSENQILRKKLDRAETWVSIYESALYGYEIAEPSDVNDLKFGDF